MVRDADIFARSDLGPPLSLEQKVVQTLTTRSALTKETALLLVAKYKDEKRRAGYLRAQIDLCLEFFAEARKLFPESQIVLSYGQRLDALQEALREADGLEVKKHIRLKDVKGLREEGLTWKEISRRLGISIPELRTAIRVGVIRTDASRKAHQALRAKRSGSSGGSRQT